MTYDNNHSSKQDAVELDKHATFERLLALGEILNAAVERVHDPG